MRISVLESITEVEIPALEEMLNHDLKDKNILTHGGIKLEIPEEGIFKIIQLAVDKFEAG